LPTKHPLGNISVKYGKISKLTRIHFGRLLLSWAQLSECKSSTTCNRSPAFTLRRLVATCRLSSSSSELSDAGGGNGRPSSSRCRASSPHARTNPDVRLTPSVWTLVSTGRMFDDGTTALLTHQEELPINALTEIQQLNYIYSNNVLRHLTPI